MDPRRTTSGPPAASAASSWSSTGLSRSLSSASASTSSSSTPMTTAIPARPLLPRYRSAPDQSRIEASAAPEERAGRAEERAAIMRLLKGRRGSWYEDEDEDEDEGRAKEEDGGARERAGEKKSWRGLYATLPALFASQPLPPAPPTVHRGGQPIPGRCRPGKALPAVGLVESVSNQLFEWIVLDGLTGGAAGNAKKSTRARRSARRGWQAEQTTVVTQTSLSLSPFASPAAPEPSSFSTPSLSFARSTDHLLLLPWEPTCAPSPVGSDTTIRPTHQQHQRQHQQRQSSPARSTTSSRSSRTQHEVAPGSPLAQWERRHRRTGSTPLSLSVASGRGRASNGDLCDDDDDDATPRLVRRTSSPRPRSLYRPSTTDQQQQQQQQQHAMTPSLSTTFSSITSTSNSTAASSTLASPSSARFGGQALRFPLAPLSSSAANPSSAGLSFVPCARTRTLASLNAQGDDQAGAVVVEDYRLASTASDGLACYPTVGGGVDVANSTLAELVFASLRSSTSATFAVPPIAGEWAARRLSTTSSSSSSVSLTAGKAIEADVFLSRPSSTSHPTTTASATRRPAYRRQLSDAPAYDPYSSMSSRGRAAEEDGTMRRSRTSVGTKRQATRESTFVGSLR